MTAATLAREMHYTVIALKIERARQRAVAPTRPPRQYDVTDDAEDVCPKTFLCPISLGIMHDPVITVVDGHTYDRGPIEAWFDCQEREGTTRFTAPLTNAVFESRAVAPNAPKG
eukprot:m.48076 g.48076  ORF g.48076 m.48076 type:complete len:114 (-) comp15251_c1_seq3:62-403(-)